MQEHERFRGVQRRTFDPEADGIRVIDEEQRIVDLSFSSEVPVKRWGCYEILSHKNGAVMLERLNASGCLLFNHDRNIVLGKVLKAEVKGRRGIARVQFDDDEKSMLYYNKVKSGTLRNTSVGYNVHEARREVVGKDDRLKVNEIATRWEPLEISIVSVPADYSVGVGREAEGAETSHTNTINKISRRALNERQLKYNYNLLSCD